MTPTQLYARIDRELDLALAARDVGRWGWWRHVRKWLGARLHVSSTQGWDTFVEEIDMMLDDLVRPTRFPALVAPRAIRLERYRELRSIVRG